MKRVLLTAVASIAIVCCAVTSAQAAKTLRWASQGDALTYDPQGQNESPTNAAMRQVHEPLVGRGEDMVKRPALATSWRAINPTTWEFKLREGVKFHDGTPFTAADVAFTFARAKMDTSDFKNVITSVKEAKVIDDHTVHIVTTGANPILPDQITTIFIMSKSWAEKHNVAKPQDYANKEETYAVRNANGTGPYRIKLREPDVRTVLERNSDWWGWGEYNGDIEEIVYTPIQNKATRVAALLSGELDFLLDPPLQDLNRLSRTSGIKLMKVAQVRTIFLGMDQGSNELRSSNIKGKNPFADRRVRQAMYQAIDIETIKKKVMRGLSVPAGIVTAPGVHGYTKALDERLPFDADASRKLLAEAGYADGFSVTLDCPNNRYNNDEAICQAVTGMLAKVGIKVNLNAQPKSLHFPKIKKRETDFYMLGWGVPTLDSHYVFGGLVKHGANWAGTNYNNEAINKAIDALEVEVDLAKRDAMIADVWKTMKEDIVYLPLHHQVITWAMKDSVSTPIFADDSVRWFFGSIK